MKEDRLSVLPDCILVEILSQLPIKDAVATSVLSRPWRYMWTHITSLHIDPLKKPIFEHIFNYFNRVDDILGRIKTPNIHSFNLNIPHRYLDSRECVLVLISLFEQICHRNVVEIKVSVFPHSRCLSKVQLPVCLLQSKSLECLEVSGVVSYKLPEDGIIRFRYLKKLKIEISSNDLNSIELLKSIPPTLQELDVFLHDLLEDPYLEICAPALKSLTIRIDVRGLFRKSKIVIDSPRLEYLKTRGDLVWYHFVSNPTQLRTANISGVTCSTNDVDQRKKLGRLVSCISSITSLRLNTFYLLPLFNTPAYSEDGEDLIEVFRNLIHLSIKARCEVEEKWSDEIPTWVLRTLKRVDVMVAIHNGDHKAIDLLEYILSNSNLLEQLIVSTQKDPLRSGDYRDQLRMKEEIFCKKLFGFSRISSNCEIQFRGNLYSASSKG